MMNRNMNTESGEYPLDTPCVFHKCILYVLQLCACAKDYILISLQMLERHRDMND